MNDWYEENVVMTYTDSRVGGILDGFQQIIVCGIKSQGECGIYYPSINVDTKIDFEYISLL